MESLINKKNQFPQVKLSLLIFWNKNCAEKLYSSDFNDRYQGLIKSTIEGLAVKNKSTKMTLLENLNNLNINSMDKLLQELLSDINADWEKSNKSNESSDTNSSSYKNQSSESKGESALESTQRQSTFNAFNPEHDFSYKFNNKSNNVSGNGYNNANNSRRNSEFKPSKTTSVISEVLPIVKVAVDFTISFSEIKGVFVKDLKK